MADTRVPTAPGPLPVEFPRTATHLLLAQPGEPFGNARHHLWTAWRALTELRDFLPPDQHALRRQFDDLAAMVAGCHEIAQRWQPAPAQIEALRRNPPPVWGEAAVQEGAPVADQPAPADHADQPVFGLADQLTAVRTELDGALAALRAPAPPADAVLYSLYLAGRAAHAARRAKALAAVFTAAVWDFERPSMPALPSAAGRIELRPSVRAIPQTRWARFSRVTFQRNRVEITHDGGHVVLGEGDPVAFLMHVVPPSPTSAQIQADPAETHAPVAHFNDLGVVHFCTADGYSRGAIAVADWISQAETAMAQPAWTGTEQENLHEHTSMVWALDSSGISAGAALLGVPIRRGATHPPPPAEPTPAGGRGRVRTPEESARAHLAAISAEDPAPGVRLLRPGPHPLPYRGTGRRRNAARKRRTGRPFGVGPASPLQPALQALAAPAVGLGGFLALVTNEPGFITNLLLLIGLLAALEPWGWWMAHWLQDRDWRRMVAVYHPGGSAHASRAFARRAEIRFDGSSIGVRGADGHEVWVASAADQDLGVTTLIRLRAEAQTWAFALADRLGRWRLLLPAAEWAPGQDLTALAGFAQRTGLALDDADVPRQDLGASPFAGTGTHTLRRSRGPFSRGMIWLTCWSAGALMLALLGDNGAQQTMLLATAVIAGGPVLIRAAAFRWYQRPAGGRGVGQAPA